MATRTVGAAFAVGENNFDAIRLIAALLVLFSHSYPLTRAGRDPISWLTGGHADGGSAAVAAFFVISGFLVTRSVLSRPPGAYIRARLLRILPAIVVVAIVQTFVIGLVFTTLPWRAYLADPRSWAGLRNATVFDLQATLPGLFATNPYPSVVNGSLWTLPIECGFYLALPLAALLGLLRPRIAAAIAALSFAAAYPAAAWFGLSWAQHGPFVLQSAPLYPGLWCLVFFMVGAAIWVHRDDLPLSGGLAVCCLLALYASAGTVSASFVFQLAYPYLVIYTALARPFTERFTRPIGDLSYGVYLYAFPVQQAVVAWHERPIGAEHLTVVATPIVLACAALSWWAIERPALLLKGPRRSRVAPAKAVACPMS